MAALYLGSKCEEQIRKMREFLAVFANMHQRREGKPKEYYDVTSAAYMEAKAELTRAERIMLRELGFTLHVEHPHKFLSSFLNFLGCQRHHTLTQFAWSALNDSMRTDLCVRLKPEAIACGCIMMAARKFQLALPLDPPWWQVFDVPVEQMELVAKETLTLYTMPKCKYVEVDPAKEALQAARAERMLKEAEARALAAAAAAERISTARELAAANLGAPTLSKHTTSRADSNMAATKRRRSSSPAHEKRDKRDRDRDRDRRRDRDRDRDRRHRSRSRDRQRSRR